MSDRLAPATTWLGALLGVGYIAAGIGGWIGDVTGGDGSELFFWVVLLCGGGVLVLAGLFWSRLTRGVALIFGIAGAAVGTLPLVWSIVVPLVALAFIVLLVLRHRSGADPVTA